ILTIAGTDPGGREGIQADLKTFAAHGCHGTSVVTAVTAQNKTGVLRHVLPPDFVEQQACITSTLKDIRVHAIKTGTLFNSEITKAVASSLKAHFRTHGRVPLVCDSVYVSDYGVVLSGEDVRTIVKELFSLAEVLTLGEAEAQYLLNIEGRPVKITSLGDMLVAAQNLLTLGPRAVLLKGGQTIVSLDDILSVKPPNDAQLEIKSDFPLDDNIEILGIGSTMAIKDHVVDVLCRPNSTEKDSFTFTLYPRPALKSKNIQGANAPFSAALACALGNETPVEEAVAQAATFTRLGIETALSFGKECSSLTLNHLHSTSRLIIHPKTSRYPYPLTLKFIQNTASLWKQYVRHDFVVQLGKGTLDRRSFEHFIKQDYIYLKYYARAYALLASKSNDYSSICAAVKAILGIVEEANLKNTMHTSFFAQWGTSLQDLERTPESPATTAYGASLIDMGLQGDTTVLIMAVAACLLGYGEVGLWLKREAQKPDSWVVWQGNPYLAWMEEYSGKEYQAGIVAGLKLMELVAETDSPSKPRYDVWFSVWERTVRFEKGFWDMALSLS
ncbi:heme oxygenase-like protein, partial [Imleria badia]